MEIQARVPAALCALHNFINRFDVEAFNDPDFDWAAMRFDERDDIPITGSDHEENIVQVGDETELANERRDALARSMWADYVAECGRRGIPLPT